MDHYPTKIAKTNQKFSFPFNIKEYDRHSMAYITGISVNGTANIHLHKGDLLQKFLPDKKRKYPSGYNNDQILIKMRETAQKLYMDIMRISMACGSHVVRKRTHPPYDRAWVHTTIKEYTNIKMRWCSPTGQVFYYQFTSVYIGGSFDDIHQVITLKGTAHTTRCGLQIGGDLSLSVMVIRGRNVRGAAGGTTCTPPADGTSVCTLPADRASTSTPADGASTCTSQLNYSMDHNYDAPKVSGQMFNYSMDHNYDAPKVWGQMFNYSMDHNYDAPKCGDRSSTRVDYNHDVPTVKL